MNYTLFSRSVGVFLLGFGLLSSCVTDKAETQPDTNGSITLNLQTLSSSHPTGSMLAEDRHQLVLTIKAGDGKITNYSFKDSEIVIQNQTLSVNYDLPSGDYELTAAYLEDITESVTYAVPNAGSLLSEKTPVSLPFAFSVVSNSSKDIDIQVLSTRNLSPEDFGLSPSILFKVCDDGVFEGNVLLQSQADVDEFGLHCYTSINGHLHIQENQKEDPIVDLSGLVSVKKISRSLDITRNSSLTSLEGLQNVGTALTVTIAYNEVLGSLNGLDGLKSVSSTFSITSNPALSSLSGLGGLVNLTHLSILANNKLPNLSGLDNLEKVGHLQITSNESFTSVSGAPKLTQMGTLLLDANNSLTTLSGFNSTIVSLGSLSISHSGISNLRGILAPEGKVNSLTLVMNRGISSLEGLSFESTIGSLDIRSNAWLSGVTELKDIQKVQGRLRISGNNSLNNFCSLTPLFTENPDSNAIITGNGYNPTAEDIIAGNCAK